MREARLRGAWWRQPSEAAAARRLGVATALGRGSSKRGGGENERPQDFQPHVACVRNHTLLLWPEITHCFFFLISKIPVSTPNEGVWDWVVVGKLGLQLLQVHCQSKTGGPPEVGAVQRAVQPLLWLLAKTHQL